MVALLVFSLILCAALTLPGMWRETQRREAYLPQLEAQARRNPYDGRLLALLGGRLAESHEFPAAAAALERAVATGEKTPEVWLTLAASVAASGDRRAGAILQVAARDQNLPEIKAALARAQAADSAPIAEARAICPAGASPLLARYAAGSLFNRPVSWWGQRHPAQSGFETRRNWAAQSPEDAQAQRLWGEALMRNRRLPEAESVLQRAVALAPKSPLAHLALADLEDQEGLPAQAILEYIATLKVRSGWPPALLGLGREALALSLPESAADVFQQAVNTAPQSADAWIGLGEADVRAQQNYDQALTAFQTAVRLAPARTDFFDDYALALKQNSRFDEVEALLRRRLVAAPTDALCHFLLASLLLDNKPTPARETVAEAETRAALRLGDARPAVRQQLSQILLHQGNTRQAITTLRASLADNAGDVNTMQTLAHVYQQAGQSALAQQLSSRSRSLFDAFQAIDVLKAEVQHDPSNCLLHQHLTVLYQKTGQSDKAQQEQSIVALLRARPELHGQGTTTLEELIRDTLASH